MAEKNDRLIQNTAGAYYVDSSCVGLRPVPQYGAEFISRDEEAGSSIVHVQPVTPEEIALAEETRQGCPSESIGNDGLA